MLKGKRVSVGCARPVALLLLLFLPSHMVADRREEHPVAGEVDLRPPDVRLRANVSHS
eukprot:COSAG04_NODE_1566_length_6320_cov_15.884102_5_plen_58_part_00